MGAFFIGSLERGSSYFGSKKSVANTSWHSHVETRSCQRYRLYARLGSHGFVFGNLGHAGALIALLGFKSVPSM